MESTRLNKIGRLIQKELGDIFQKQTQGMPGILISVSAVRVSPDLGVAKAYLSIFPSEKGKELLESGYRRVFPVGNRIQNKWSNRGQVF